LYGRFQCTYDDSSLRTTEEALWLPSRHSKSNWLFVAKLRFRMCPIWQMHVPLRYHVIMTDDWNVLIL
jgi:hypothetical protein